jgi:SAM-dependent methyltransferase
MVNPVPFPSANRNPVFRVNRKVGTLHLARSNNAFEGVAAIYNQAGDGYAAYADGDPDNLFAFDGLHAYADHYLWTQLDAKLVALRAAGSQSVNILDAGCGPGTWLRRLVTRANALGFTKIIARGFDIAQAQIERARFLSEPLCALPGVLLHFEVADLTGRLPEADRSVDLTLCLYSVLSHLPVAEFPKVSAEFARVTAGHFFTTVRPIGSPPSIFIDSMEKAQRFKHDSSHDSCQIELSDGRHFTLNIHLFAASELRSYFADRFDIEMLRGLDLFHSRFSPDLRWNPASSVIGNDRLASELSQIEEIYASSPRFIEHAAHLLLIGRAHNERKGGSRGGS